MVKVASALARGEGADALVTGDSLGQVASQTLPNLAVVGEAADLPLLRPLIDRDKAEIVDIARRLGTYEISILPDEDCCKLFSSRLAVTRGHPTTCVESSELPTPRRWSRSSRPLPSCFGRGSRRNRRPNSRPHEPVDQGERRRDSAGLRGHQPRGSRRGPRIHGSRHRARNAGGTYRRARGGEASKAAPRSTGSVGGSTRCATDSSSAPSSASMRAPPSKPRAPVERWEPSKNPFQRGRCGYLPTASPDSSAG